MSKVKNRMLEIINSLPEDYFENKTRTEMILMLVKEYLDKYGEDETTIIPGTNMHINLQTLENFIKEY